MYRSCMVVGFPAGQSESSAEHRDTKMAQSDSHTTDKVVRTAEEIEKPHVHGDSDTDGHSTTSHNNDGDNNYNNGDSAPQSSAIRRIASRPNSFRTLSRAPSRTISLLHDGIETRHDRSLSIDLVDVELGPRLQEKTTTTAPDPSDPNLVTWSDPQENPKNWPFARKWVVVFIASMFTLMSPLSSTIVAPALTTIGEDFAIDDTTLQFLTLSIFILGFSVGPVW